MKFTDVKILLVDDDAGHRQLMNLNLKRSHIANDIIEFCDGLELLNFFEGSQKSGAMSGQSFVIFLDIRMPKMSGVEVLQSLKADPYLKRIPVIMVSTTDDPDEVVRCYELGCSHYVTKPIDYEQFIKAVQKLGLFLSVVNVPPLD